MSDTDGTTRLLDWLPILTHQEYGQRICEASGVDVWTRNDVPDEYVCSWGGFDFCKEEDEPLPTVVVAALAHGVEVVMSDSFCLVYVRRANGGWEIEFDMGHDRGSNMSQYVTAPTLPGAWLAAAARVWINVRGSRGER